MKLRPGGGSVGIVGNGTLVVCKKNIGEAGSRKVEKRTLRKMNLSLSAESSNKMNVHTHLISKRRGFGETLLRAENKKMFKNSEHNPQ